MATIADTPAPEPRKRRGVVTLIAYGDRQRAPKVPSQAEEGEKPVAAEPRLGRDVFAYLEPRKGIDAPSEWRECASCRSYVPERAFHGAQNGNRCLLFGGSFPVEPYAYCHRFCPWPMGAPIEHAIASHALMLLNHPQGSVSPFTAGYCEDPSHKHRCKFCRQFDPDGDVDSPGAECEFYGELNEKLPAIFALNEKVDPDAGCDSWSEPPREEGEDGSGY